jgi:RNA polymerase sigma factor (sigma-70 family)
VVAATDRSAAAPSGFVINSDSFADVVHVEWASMIRLAVLLIGDPALAEDVVAECCERVWRVKPAVTDREHLIAYLRTSVVNRCRSARRRQRTADRYLSFFRLRHAPAADHDLLVREDQRELLIALGRLPARQQEVLILRYWSRLTEAQIADTLGIPPGTVKSTAHRAPQTLHSTLKGSR